MTDEIFIEKLTFSIAHYLQGHHHCGVLHGHTYFLTDIKIKCNGFVDFGDVKGLLKEWLDHRFVVPQDHAQFWRNVVHMARKEGIHLQDNIVSMDIPCTTVENMSKWIQENIKRAIPTIKKISFKLAEGPNQGVIARSK